MGGWVGFCTHAAAAHPKINYFFGRSFNQMLLRFSVRNYAISLAKELYHHKDTHHTLTHSRTERKMCAVVLSVRGTFNDWPYCEQEREQKRREKKHYKVLEEYA